MKVAVLGAGVSGLTVARILNDRNVDVVLYEKESTVGGLAQTRFKDGVLYDPHGGHIMSPKISRVTDWIFNILPINEWQYTERNAKIYFDGKFVSYPYELSLFELDIEDQLECAYDYIVSQSGDEPSNFRDWIYWNFGKGIAERYMIPYNEKVWAYPLKLMETKWMKGKMPLPSKRDILKSVIEKKSVENKTAHSSFYYPLHGGIQTMVNKIAEGINLRVNTPIESIRKGETGWIINDDDEFDKVVSTIPLKEIRRVYLGIPTNVANAIDDLKYNSLNTVLFSCEATDITWLYIPSREYLSHRIGYQSTLTPFACPNQSVFGCGALEIIGNPIENVDKLPDMNVLPKELGFNEVLDYEFTKYAYVIHDLNYRKNLNIIFGYFDDNVKGFYLLGRWGRWNYKNMDLCMNDAIELADFILSGGKE